MDEYAARDPDIPNTYENASNCRVDGSLPIGIHARTSHSHIPTFSVLGESLETVLPSETEVPLGRNQDSFSASAASHGNQSGKGSSSEWDSCLIEFVWCTGLAGNGYRGCRIGQRSG